MKPERKICFVTYETRFSGRLDATAGLALLIASLGRHMPDIPLFVLHTEPCDHLKRFAERHGPSCAFEKVDRDAFFSWFGKPYALFRLLDRGFDRVCWIDSDILVTKDCTDLLFPDDDCIMRVTQVHNTPKPKEERHIYLFGLPPVSKLNTSVSSAVISVTKKHCRVIEKWYESMKRKKFFLEKYKLVFQGDQEFLEASLMNENYSDIVVSPLRNDFEHFTCVRGGMGMRRYLRLLVAFRLPPLIHASGYKAWWPLDRSIQYSSRSYLDCTPYVIQAKCYADLLSELEGLRFVSWLSPSSSRSRICRSLPPWNFASAWLWYGLSVKLFGEIVTPSEKEKAISHDLARSEGLKQ